MNRRPPVRFPAWERSGLWMFSRQGFQRTAGGWSECRSVERRPFACRSARDSLLFPGAGPRDRTPTQGVLMATRRCPPGPGTLKQNTRNRFSFRFYLETKTIRSSRRSLPSRLSSGETSPLGRWRGYLLWVFMRPLGMAPQDPLRIQGGRSGISRDPWGPEHLDPAFHIGRRMGAPSLSGVP